MERAWVESTLVESFLTGVDATTPINVIGRSDFLRERLAQQRPDLRLRTIRPLGAGEPLPALASDGDVLSVSVDDLAGALLPRSRTLILNPFLAQGLFTHVAFWKALSLKTYEWAVAPFFLVPEPYFVLYSEQFSFEEPVRNDDAEHWCWTKNPEPGTVLIVNGGAAGAYLLEFTLGAANPGNLTIELANVTLRRTVTREVPNCRVTLVCNLVHGANALRIGFEGEPFIPDYASDQREHLFFSFAYLRLTPRNRLAIPPSFAVSGVAPVRDRHLRRILHAEGFFDIEAIGTSAPALAHYVGSRSCLDLREGFRYRDYRRYRPAQDISRQPSYLDLPVAWYSIRKTPIPGSEWEDAPNPPAAEPCSLLEECPAANEMSIYARMD